MSEGTQRRRHPLHAFAGRVHEVLDELTNASHLGMAVEELAESVVELHRAEARLAGLGCGFRPRPTEQTWERRQRVPRLRGWLRRRRWTRRRARREVVLTASLQGPRSRTGESLESGMVSWEQAEVIVAAVESLPSSVGAEGRAKAELHLLEKAKVFGPQELRVLGRRIFEVVDPEAAELHLGRQLARQEEAAARKTFLTLWDDGAGTTWGRFAMPTLNGDMLATALNALASPRRSDAYDRTDQHGGRVTNSVLLGQAFVEYVERYPVDRLPHTGGLNTTLLVSIDAASLTDGLKAADLLNGHLLSAGQARRLACEAGLVPQVLGGASAVLDYGRERRFHTAAQRKVIHARDRTCRAEGCDIPANWCHVHHRVPFSRGGATSIAEGHSLCPRHHKKAHDAAFASTVLASGEIRFSRIRQ